MLSSLVFFQSQQKTIIRSAFRWLLQALFGQNLRFAPDDTICLDAVLIG